MSTQENARRATRAKKALTAVYDFKSEKRTAVIDLLADLRHLCDKYEWSFGDLDRSAHEHYLIEVGKTTLLILICLVSLTGCVNMTVRPQPEDRAISESHLGEDCVSILFGIGIGTATVEQAMAHGYPRNQHGDYNRTIVPIAHVRRIELSDYQFMGFGARCIEVTGEAAS